MTLTSTPDAPLWTLEQVAEFTATPVSTLYSLRSARRGPTGFRIGRALRFRPEDVRIWIEELIEADGSAA
jgi:predicted DNA-binding transcriptional regulator AlpA